MFHNLKENAIFVADSHLNKKNDCFLVFLKKLEASEIKTSQLILMGDNFDFICAQSYYFLKINKEAIDILNNLSLKIEILYLEGNHDYNLQAIFPKIKVIKREQQPYILTLKNEKEISLSHGDNFIDWKYDLYCKVIRNSYFLKSLNFVDINFWLSKKIEKHLLEKNICHKIKNFKEIVNKRLNNYNSDIIIEGHYHQGEIYNLKNKLYINIPSLFCTKEYMVFKNGEFLKEKLC